MRARPGRCHLLISSKIPQVVYISETTIKLSRKIDALGRVINNCILFSKLFIDAL